ncbi:MAG: hypothetical protein HQ582_22965 [Planctomycetes bacterium]|nr:hypothetical protein [Planctomycetota bacterium]
MSFDASTEAERDFCRTRLADALKLLDDDGDRRLFDALFGNIFGALVEARIGNPVAHQVVVLEHMLEIAKAEGFKRREMQIAAALALLHDIGAVKKITEGQVKALRMEAEKADPTAAEAIMRRADALDLERRQSRTLHMRKSSYLAQKAMSDFNSTRGEIVFDEPMIETICEIIRIHDNPTLDLPIPRSNWMAVCLREADRLWMVTRLGILADLLRQSNDEKPVWANDLTGVDVKSVQRLFRGWAELDYSLQVERFEESLGSDPLLGRACGGQMTHNKSRFVAERKLYPPDEGPFIDDETFFRTQKGHEIYRGAGTSGR